MVIVVGLIYQLSIRRPSVETQPDQKGDFVCPASSLTRLSLIIERLLDSKRASGRRPIYVKSLAHYLYRFAQGRECIEEITTEQIEQFLLKCTAGNTRATWLNRISTLFSYAVKRGIIEKNPCDRVERQRIDRHSPQILTPAESSNLMSICPTLCKPYLILGMYVGIRPEEIQHIEWKDINLETKTVAVNHTKTRRRRIVPLEPIAARLLSECPIKQGRVSPSLSTVRRFRRRARSVLGVWQADLLRHTAASYLLALHKDSGKVATMLGNSSKILLTHYHTPVTEKDCSEFWATN